MHALYDGFGFHFFFSKGKIEILHRSDHHHRITTKRLYNHSTLKSEFTCKKKFDCIFEWYIQCVSSKMDMITLPASNVYCCAYAEFVSGFLWIITTGNAELTKQVLNLTVWKKMKYQKKGNTLPSSLWSTRRNHRL